ncbi:hypothetical protein GCM10010399_64060 [Dactylosporangium fulvum]|uniref:Uncharacterized protein n=1 Tax=Dactylosporangium fulvum TaxID=53359 RepID=A0ABY5W9K4_9ACTN|nr:hypothetical protein [Dactylosporangium fulvum]UWP85771.1 hypothetical protein Dfulv_16625 [Dactylosporangium fulvum]
MTIYDTLTGPVSAELHQRGITLVISANGQTRGDAWCDAVAQHGDRVASIHLTDGRWVDGRPRYYDDRGYYDATVLRVSYPWDDVETGTLIRDVLVKHGLTVEWEGDGAHAIVIKL